MEHEILNCFELDIRQDIPAEMELLKQNSELIKTKNKVLKTVLLGIVFGLVAVVLYHKIKENRENKGAQID